MLKDKHILLGISGSIAAYVACDLARSLIKAGAQVQVVMTEGAKQFVTPLTMQTLTGRPVIQELFDEVRQWDVEHVGAAKWADVYVVAPATANVMAKLALGLADDSLSASFLACDKPKVIAPAMNTVMYENPATRANDRILRERGCLITEPQVGLLACGDIGKGKLADVDVIMRYVEYALETEKPLHGRKVLVTAGPTREEIDPVRFLSNHSTGRMGYAVAYEAWLLGAKVTLISGPVDLAPLPDCETIMTGSAQEMADAVFREKGGVDIIVKAAAVADYTPKARDPQKIKKQDGNLTLEFIRTTDILAELGKTKPSGQVLVGFAAETQDMLDNARGKMQKKNVDLMAANDLTSPGSGFGTATNQLLLLWPNGSQRDLGLLSKEEAAKELLLAAHKIWLEKNHH
ncbi:MAG: bifunctional phosphopantothenoylcysteine decarboxylase/phosphopantothenate--cysteine ligase CoaBC [Peptococcaceae bacterium]|nr:bifunctional phosphopantothenoylcysteine decarboxylase/phosphopantothenate--cysteine ligase CoaBC [Peptococcaceae bacterium]